MKDAAAALAKIAAAKATFVSRGDKSGTNVKEKELWADAGIKPAGDWYLEAGQGMGEVLTMADQRQGYTLSDRGTYLAYKGKIDLKVLVEGDKRLFNPYGVIAVNPAKYPHVKYQLAEKFMRLPGLSPRAGGDRQLPPRRRPALLPLQSKEPPWALCSNRCSTRCG